MRRIAVTGGRDFINFLTIRKAFKEINLNENDILVHGGCHGCDKLCSQIAKNEFNAKIEEHKADWQKYGKAAGPIRNKEMLKSNIDMLLVFRGWKGTNNCVEEAKKLKINIRKFL